MEKPAIPSEEYLSFAEVSIANMKYNGIGY